MLPPHSNSSPARGERTGLPASFNKRIFVGIRFFKICSAVMKREIIICSFWLLLSFYLSVESYRLGLSTANRPGPGFFPFIATLGIGLIAAFRLINNIRKRPADDNSEPGMANEARLVLYVVAGMIAYALLLDSSDFFSARFCLWRSI